MEEHNTDIQPNGAALKKARRRLGFTQQALEDRTMELGDKVSVSTIARAERNHFIHLSSLRAIANALDTPPSQLMFDAQPHTPTSDSIPMDDHETNVAITPTAGGDASVSHLPQKLFYSGIISHDRLIADAIECLSNSSSSRCLLLWGMGGLGKSTIAAELSRQLLSASNFSDVVWLPMPPCGKTPILQENMFLRRFAEATGYTLGLSDPDDADFTFVTDVPKLHNSLLIIDNIDPSLQDLTALAAALEIIPCRRIAMTSRVRLDLFHAQTLQIHPLEPEDAVQFVRADAAHRRLESLLPQDSRLIREFCEAGGGCPFALQLGLGYARSVPWSVMVREFPRAHQGLFNYLFRRLWRRLGATSQNLLIYMRTSADGVPIDELLDSTTTTRSEAVIALNELVECALLQVHDVTNDAATYVIHPLTLSFIESELPQLWGKEQDEND